MNPGRLSAQMGSRLEICYPAGHDGGVQAVTTIQVYESGRKGNCESLIRLHREHLPQPDGGSHFSGAGCSQVGCIS